MAQRMLGVVFTLVLKTGTAVNALLAKTRPLRPLVTLPIEVVWMVWWAMPWITRRRAGWIYPTHMTS
jgi:antibiotic biosynthesis monooxygenase (ABM) superfamily enzyme